MKIRSFGFCLLIVVFSAPVFSKPVTGLGSDDRTAVEVTVYNNNLGLVKDSRKVDLPPGVGELRFKDVASCIMPVTVRVRSLNYPDDFSVIEQNYEYDLINERKLLDKYVGRKIKIIDWNKFKDRKEEVEAVLLSNNQGQIYRINDEIYLGHPGYKVLPEIPENLIAKPTLTWLYENKSKNAHKLEVAYLTSNINWKADYVAVLNKDDTSSGISGWVTIDNKSGATYEDAKLKLIAGEVHRVDERLRRQDYMAKTVGVGAPAFEAKPFFEYHIYNLQRKTTIKNNQTKQVSLLEADGVKVEKELLVYGAKNYFSRRYREKKTKQPVDVYVKFRNSGSNNLGMPLPGGIVRLYKEDEEGSLQFIGEDRLEHTPRDEEVRLKIGESFDVVAERRQTDYRKIATTLHESEWEITLRNHKETEVTVGVVETLSGSWKVISSSHKYRKVDAFTIRFDVKVPKDGEVKVKYKIRVGL